MPRASTLLLSQTICRLFAACESARETAPELLQTLCTLAPYDAVEIWLQRTDSPRRLGACGTDAPQRRIDVENGFLLVTGEPGAAVDELARDVATFLIRRTLADTMLFELTSALEQTAEHVLITDRDGNIQYANAAFEKATGYTKQELEGRTPSILKSGAHSPEFYENMWRSILGGEVFRDVFINQTKDGKPLYEEKTIAPIRNAAGEITHFVSTGRDISERLVAEWQEEELKQALENIAREWRETFDTIDMPILLVDGSGIIRRVNRAAQQLIGEPFPSIVGIPLDGLPHREPWLSLRELVRRSSPDRPSAAIRTSDPDSQRAWEVASMFGEPHTILVIRDVTTVSRLQESLRETEVMSKLGAIVAGVAHEVRNPLFGISATIDALEAQPDRATVFEPFMRRLRGELDRLNGLMVELLEYGRPGDRELAPSLLATPLLDAARTLEPLADKLSVRMHVDVTGARGVMVMADAARLQLAFRNLLENAIQYAGSGGTVEAAAVQNARGAEVSVCDSGRGFPEADLPHLFEPFFTRRRGGTGLGLSIVQRIVEQHFGTITAGNRENGGAIVRVTLPVI